MGQAQESTSDVQETIQETTVGLVAGVRVGMGNVVEGSYTLPDGRETRGLICSLALPDRVGVFVGMGSQIEIGGRSWSVVRVQKERGKSGWVTLQAI